ncbi:MAG: pyruvate, water dikinase regulatory protein [Clostridia bacterium]
MLATVFVVSDSLGETAEQVVRGAAIQFDGDVGGIRVVRVPHVGNEDAVHAAVAQAQSQPPSLIVYTLVRPELRECLHARAEEAGVRHIDLMGPVLEALAEALHREPQLVPGLSHRLDREYFDRVEAVEFAVKYDDGKDPAGVLQADVVILGVSRTSKTPVSLYLANHRLKVANIPLVPEVPVPAEVFKVGRKKCVGLVIDPDMLSSIRLQRLKAIGLSSGSPYANPERIRAELDYAFDVYQRLGCPVVDVTNHAVEETASRVLEIVQQEGRAV